MPVESCTREITLYFFCFTGGLDDEDFDEHPYDVRSTRDDVY